MSLNERREKSLLVDKGCLKKQPHQIIQALDLTSLNFNVISTRFLLKFKPTICDGFGGCQIGSIMGWEECKRGLHSLH